MTNPPAADFNIRVDALPEDVVGVVALHAELYAKELGFDPSFENYVAKPLSEFVRAKDIRGRLWLAQQDSRLVGRIAVVPSSTSVAPIRWFLVAPEARGRGLGRKLLENALQFCQEAGFERIFLLTVSALTTAARLYRAAGFQKVEATPHRLWGVGVVEERYEFALNQAN